MRYSPAVSGSLEIACLVGLDSNSEREEITFSLKAREIAGFLEMDHIKRVLTPFISPVDPSVSLCQWIHLDIFDD